ncbi:MAG: ADP-forming succinate--CoA ligase subunit beta [Candidatus Omnitrophota bacterium]|nr:ADP-forming succinate--CoA ligase subunit beta [Candidatus Omnitrophota bacterium]
MKLHEYQAKEILKAQGVPVPQGAVADNSAAGLAIAQSLGFPLAIKAQIYVGGRGKAGAIRIASDQEELQKALTEILGMSVKGLRVKKVLIEKALDIKEQFYLSITVDRSKQSNAILVSDAGGIDIEETARLHPEKIMKIILKNPRVLEEEILLKAASFLHLTAALRTSYAEIVRALFAVYVNTDAELAEINPLVLTQDNQFIACDAKIVIDDNALFRHQDLKALKEEAEDNELEKEAHRRNLAYVKLSGNIGIIGNGAGLVMATMDEVEQVGGKPANFLDIGGGAKREVVENALEVLTMDKDVKGIFINIFGGITRCDEVAQGIIQITKERSPDIPIVLRLAGTQCEEGRRLLGKSNLITAESMEEGAKKIVALVNG